MVLQLGERIEEKNKGHHDSNASHHEQIMSVKCMRGRVNSSVSKMLAVQSQRLEFEPQNTEKNGCSRAGYYPWGT